MIIRVARAHRDGEFWKFLSQAPPLVYAGSMMAPLSSVRSRNCRPFQSVAWKYIFHKLTSESHSSLRQKSHDVLHGKW